MTAIRVAAGPGSLSQQADSDPADSPWSPDQMLLASILDAIRALQWTYVAAHSKTPPRQPEPVPRPGLTTARSGRMTVDMYRQLTGEDPPLHLVEGGA